MTTLHTLAAAATTSDTAGATAATGFTAYAWLLVALPALGAAVLLFGGRATDRWGPLFAVAMSWAAFVVGFVVWLSMIGRDAESRAASVHLFEWIPAGSLKLDAGLLVDQLSVPIVVRV